ncbi:MAG TPA: hypothetical protein VLJ15_02965 [Gammaproteobacteria bacterium]|nr:hypothetical protein [Gammaproteobacteria bacterium]
MKLAKIILAIGLSCLGFSIYAADQVVKEDTTPPGSEGPLTVNQIPPVYTQPAPAAPQQPSETRQPVMPSNTPTPPPVETVPAPQTTPQQPEQPGAQPATPPQNTEQPVTQQTNQPPVMQQ